MHLPTSLQVTHLTCLTSHATLTSPPLPHLTIAGVHLSPPHHPVWLMFISRDNASAFHTKRDAKQCSFQSQLIVYKYSFTVSIYTHLCRCCFITPGVPQGKLCPPPSLFFNLCFALLRIASAETCLIGQ